MEKMKGWVEKALLGPAERLPPRIKKELALQNLGKKRREKKKKKEALNKSCQSLDSEMCDRSRLCF